MSEEGSDRRTHFRIRAKMAARFREASPEELEALERQIAVRTPTSASKVEPELLDHVARLERKLDQVLCMLAPELPPPLLPTESREIELSGAGMGQYCEAPVAIGLRVLCELLVPGFPPHPVRAVGRIVSCKPEGEGFYVGIAFEHIDERDRDAIVRFSNRLQIRERNDATSRQEQDSGPDPDGPADGA